MGKVEICLFKQILTGNQMSEYRKVTIEVKNITCLEHE